MKYIKEYKLFERAGDDIENDHHLELLNDLSLDIKDLGFEVGVKGYESYTFGYNIYDIIIESKDNYSIYDVGIDNISELDIMYKKVDKINKLNSECLNLIKRSIDNGLYLCSYETTIKSDLFCFIRFTCKEDGSPVEDGFRAFSEDEDEDYF